MSMAKLIGEFHGTFDGRLQPPQSAAAAGGYTFFVEDGRAPPTTTRRTIGNRTALFLRSATGSGLASRKEEG